MRNSINYGMVGGGKDAFIGMSSFGASGPAEELYDYFKINKAELVEKSRNMLK